MTSDSPPTGGVAEKTNCPTDVAQFTSGTCCYSLTIDATTGVPTATVTIIGSGKFNGLTAHGTKTGTVSTEATASATYNCTPS
jgi:hypothetical protein